VPEGEFSAMSSSRARSSGRTNCTTFWVAPSCVLRRKPSGQAVRAGSRR